MYFRFKILFALTIFVFACTEDSTDPPTSNENHAPVVTSVSVTPDTVAPNNLALLTCIVTDADSDTIVYNWSSLKGTFPNGKVGDSITWQAPSDTGLCLISVIVNDGNGGNDSGEVTVVVQAQAIKSPVITGLTAYPVTLEPGDTSILNCIAVDPNGDSLTYKWQATGGNISGNGRKAIWIAPNKDGCFDISVTVENGKGSPVEAEVYISTTSNNLIKAIVIRSWGNRDYYIWKQITTDPKKFGSRNVSVDYKSFDHDTITYKEIVCSAADVLILDMSTDLIESEVAAIKRYVMEDHGIIVTGGTFRILNHKELIPLLGYATRIYGRVFYGFSV